MVSYAGASATGLPAPLYILRFDGIPRAAAALVRAKRGSTVSAWLPSGKSFARVAAGK